MASGERYRKTTTSEIISSSFKNVLRQIKTTKLKIEETEERVNQLSNEFKSLQVNNFDDKNYNEHGNDMNTEEESFVFASGDGSAHLLAFLASYAELF